VPFVPTLNPTLQRNLNFAEFLAKTKTCSGGGALQEGEAPRTAAALVQRAIAVAVVNEIEDVEVRERTPSTALAATLRKAQG
jgi:hypothetical protein